MVFEVVDSFEGKSKFFKEEKDAKSYKRQRRQEIHQKYCVEKWGPSNCLCSETNKQQQCAAHHYLYTTPDHELEHCPLKQDVGIRQIKVE